MNKHLQNRIIIITMIIMLIAFAAITTQNTLTGKTIQTTPLQTEILNITTETNTTIQLTLENINELRITGNYTGKGTAKIILQTTNGEFVIHEIKPSAEQTQNLLTGFVTKENETNTTTNETSNVTVNQTINKTTEEIVNTTTNQTNITTNKTINQNNTIVNQTNETINETVNETTEEIVNETINQTVNETNIIINETTNQTINETPIIEENTTYTENFNNECKETCTLQTTNTTNITIQITDGTLYLEKITYKQTIQETIIENITQIKTIPNQQTNLNNITINLSEYFTGTEIFYDMTYSEGYTYSISEDILTITPTKTGNWTARIYAATENETITSNEFNIIISGAKVDEKIIEELKTKTTVRAILKTKKIDTVQISSDKKTKKQKKVKEKTKNELKKEFKWAENKTDNELTQIEDKNILGTNTTLPVEVEQDLGNVKSVIIDSEKLAELSNNPDVEEIIIDNPVSILTSETINITKIDLVQSTGYSGSGQTICILDTGANTEALGLVKDQNVFGYNFIDDNDNYSDGNGHGTKVTYPITQIAPDSKYIIAKVINDQGEGYESDVLAGLDYCAQQNATVISLSIGSGEYAGYCDENLVAQEVNNLSTKSIIVAATGNDGTNTIKSPACATNVTPVASSTKTNTIASFSNYNNATLLVAPGQNIQTIDNYENSVSESGTSMSVPFVSGTAALIFENRTITPIELRDLFVHTGDLIDYNGRQFSQLNAWNALTNNITNNLTPSGEQTNGTESNFTTQTVISLQVSASSDDASGSGSTVYTLTQTYVDQGNDGTGYNSGYRFNNVDIPQGSTITSANFTMKEDWREGASVYLIVKAEDIDDAPTFSTTSGNISSRATTTNSVNWNSPTATTAVSPDLSAVIEEVTNRSGWSANNSLVILITESGSSQVYNSKSYDSGASNAATLDIAYTAPSGNNPPTYSNNQTNNTDAGQSTLFSVLVNDDTALQTNGQYIFSTNNTGTWVNDSAVNFTTTSQWANVTKTLNSTVGLSIGYMWYATDNTSNASDTGIYTLTTTTDYALNIVGPTTSSTINVNDADNISINFTFTDTDGSNLTSGVTVDNITIGGEAATIISGGQQSAIYYYNDYSDAATWDANPGNVVDGSLSTYGNDNDNSNSYITLNATNYTTSPGGTINSVEVRSYWRNNNAGASTSYIPLFGGSSAGDNHDEPTDLKSTPAWGAWYDITTDTNAPSTWTWNDVEQLDMKLDTIRTAGQYRGYMVQIRVNYTSTQFAYISGTGWVANVTVPSGLSGAQDLFLNATYSGNTRSDTQTGAVVYPGGSTIPNTPTPSINSTDGTNGTTQDLNCWATITDPNSDDLNVSTKWYKNGILNISADYNNSYSSGTVFNLTLDSGNTTLGNNWSCSIRTHDGTNYSDWGSSANLTIINIAPTTTTPTINSTDGTNTTNQDLNCNATISDVDGDLLNVSTSWYKNGVLNLSIDYNNSYASGTMFNVTLQSENTTSLDNWSCYIRAHDGTEYSSWANSVNLTIKANTAPTTPTTITCDGGTCNSTFSTSVDLQCSGSTDADSDTITYVLEKGNGTSGGTNSTSSQVSSGSDDMEECESDGDVSSGSSDLEIGYEGTSDCLSGPVYVGVRFLNVQVPQGATITNATIEFEVDELDGDTDGDVNITGEDADTSPPLSSSTTYNISNRIDTTAYVEWTLPTSGSPNDKKYTANISTIIEEIVGRSGWSSGNNITIIFHPAAAAKRVYEAYEGEPTNTALLRVDYSTGSTEYTVIGNHTGGSSYTWDLSGEAVGETYEYLQCRAIDLAGTNTYSSYYNEDSNFTVGAETNTAPNTPTPSINSTDGTNTTTQDLNCQATITDDDNDNLNVTVNWYKNTTLSLTIDYNNSYANGTVFNATLDSGNTTVDDSWICGIKTHDGTTYGTEGNSTALTILQTYGTLNVAITYPTTDITLDQNTTFQINATVTCNGTTSATCGTVYANARYNTTANPDTLISTNYGATPLLIENNGFGTPLNVWNVTDTDGYTSNGITVDPSGYVYVVGKDSFDHYIVKYDENGTHIWNITDSSGKGAYGVVTDSTEYFYVTGLSTTGYYTSKYNSSDGTKIWNTTDTNGNTAYDIAIDQQGNIYVTGKDDNDLFYTVKYNSTGQQQWNVTTNIVSPGSAYGIDVDQQGNVYVVGFSFGFDYVTVKYNSTGQQQWNVTDTNGFVAYGITADQQGNVYVTGREDSSNYYTVKYNSIGQQQWNVTDTNGNYAYGLVSDEQGNLYITGLSDANDYYTVKYNSTGQQQWNVTDTNGSEAKDIFVDRYGNVYLTGITSAYDYYTLKYTQSNPQYLSLNKDDSWNVTWTVNATGDIGTSNLVDVLFNSSYGNSLVADNNTADRKITITAPAGNTAPTIPIVEAISAKNPIESSTKEINVTFTVNDIDGNDTINVSTAKAIYTLNNVQRTSTSCTSINNNATSLNITCPVNLQYYDEPGTWNINVSINDTSGSYTENTSTTFIYNELSAITISQTLLDFGNVNIGEENITTTPIIINNTGNANYTYTTLTAYNLINQTYTINAGNFTVNTTNSSTGTTLQNNTPINITNSILTRTTDSTEYNKTIYIYLDVPNIALPARYYYSIAEWILTAEN